MPEATAAGAVSPCCAPRGRQGAARAQTGAADPGAAAALADAGLSLVALAGATFFMGSDWSPFPHDGESPVRPVTVDAFRISAHAVTNRQFARFCEATGYRTDAERAGSSFVFHAFVPASAAKAVRGWVREAPWWADVAGACWHAPEGPGSHVDDRLDHPVVHVSHDDALAFCRWAGLRLPTEPEWEYAARGGLEQRRYPWGDDLRPHGRWRCNIWQGRFPVRDTGRDGHVGTAPVDAYEPNGHGLYNVVGNVWEWCADPFRPSPGRAPRAVAEPRAIRGGSYLCHESYCYRYRVSARSGNTPGSSTGHMGFRAAAGPAA